MKRVTVLLLILMTVLSCSDEIKFNTPAVQGKKDGDFWRAVYYDASYNEAGRVVLIGGSGNEELKFTVPNLELGAKWLGRGSSSKAEFEDSDGVFYSTNRLPDPELSFYPPDGEIEITQVTATSVSGRFWFNAFSNSGMETVNFSQGVFFDIPLNNLEGGLMSCDEVVAEAQAAEELYNNTDPGSTQYTEVCLAYKEALEQQIATCGGGGANSPLQIIINGLGDCQ
ncbi:hypothetical protein C1T31_02915 [Hanstruepera neustonica]|uniref:Lipoprotein n=1 Tax=Hanstruepera neustonica TaxID=1445657 RepID=A0A2K1E495_9FLAO|nr:DUF6252 family protein [Hanstruepera neustonica]PNQ75104.1 hypothetical protein C1T31_02915 [Hanstruepera neustonica]